MKQAKWLINLAAILVLGICIYSFLLGNEAFKNKFTNDAISWYILAKGIFCSLVLYLLGLVVRSLEERKN